MMMNRKTDPYRNAHGVELKPGNWFMGADEYGHKEGIIDRVVKSGLVVELNGGVSVVYRSAPGEHAVQSILADNVMQTLGPMIIERDGTVKQNPIGNVANLKKRYQALLVTLADLRNDPPDGFSKSEIKNMIGLYMQKAADLRAALAQYQQNPLTRVKVKSPAQRGGAAPSERLTKRRKVTQKAPPGFYANPTPRLSRADQDSQREHFNPKTGRMTKRATPRLKERRALTHYQAKPGVWANPLQSRTVSQREANALGATYAPSTLQSWNDHYIVQKRQGEQKAWEGVSVFKKREDAFTYARALARQHETWSIRVVRPEK